MSQIFLLQALRTYYERQLGAPCLNIYTADDLLKQIVLIRHGEPDIEKKGWYNRKKAKVYADNYDKVGIKRFDSNPLCMDDLDPDIKIYHSPMPRARHTAHLIFGSRRPMTPDVRFREFERKLLPFFNIHLPLGFWTGMSRFLWYLGINNRGIENVKRAKLRAKGNALFLAEEARAQGTVIVVAHGFHNRYVSKYLQKEGWEMVREGGLAHLSINILASVS